MPSEKVLICGAGVAGSVLAFWLAKHDFDVVVVERSKAGQKLGQGIEIEEPALQVVKAMGIFDELNRIKTGEAGFKAVDQQDRVYGRFDVGSFSPTGALELMRGDLTEILYHAANRSPNVAYRFETKIHSLRQTDDKVIVELQNRNDKSTQTEEFDIVVGADGSRSQTRQLVMGSPEQLDCYKKIGIYVAYFSVPKEQRDWPYSKLCNFTKRRIILMRPTREESDVTSVYVVHAGKDIPALDKANAANDREKQKAAIADFFSGLGWEAPRVMKQMMTANNFYSDELVQVKLQKWSQHRVVLVGDSAWAPTPLTGQGNQLAIIGAWVLAQELSRDRTPGAFDKYEKRLRSYVEQSQQIPLNGYAPYLINPETSLGIWTLRNIIWLISSLVRFVAWTKITSLIPQKPNFNTPFDLQMATPTASGSMQ